GAPAVVVLGHELWTGLFANAPDVLGQRVRIDGREATVVGVMPEGFRFPVNQLLWTPLRPADFLATGENPPVDIFARLAPGVSLVRARAEIAALPFEGDAATLRPFVGSYPKAMLEVVMGIGHAINASALVVLLLVCANVSLLIFARLTAREGEIIVRSAIGAARRRIVLQLVLEVLVLGGFGAILGLGGAAYVLERMITPIATIERPLPFWMHDTLALRTILYTAG